MPAAGEAGEKPGGSESPVEVRLKDVGTMVTRLTGQLARKVKPPLQRKPSRGGAVIGLVVLAAVLFFLFTYEWDPHERAQEYIEEGKHEKAIKTLSAITEDNPQDHQAFFKLGGEYARAGDAEKSLAAYSAALALNPDYKKSPKMIKALLHLPRGEKAKPGLNFIIDKAGSSSSKVLEKELTNPDYDVHWNAYRALERMGTRKDMLPLLILDLETNPDCEIRKQAVQKMGELRDRDALPALQTAQNKSRNQKGCMGDSIEKAIDKIKSSPKRSSSASGSKDPIKKLEKGLRKIFDR
ncbi:MAG: HEAT repeat domain-containing protein [bacterium]